MRLSMYFAALAVALTATVPAFAQSSNLNSINNSLAAQSENRAMMQQQTTDFDRALMALMQSESNQMF